MNIEIQGVLRFKHRAGLEKGLTAFDENAYPEFFKSELWSLSGQYAQCKRSFEIEPDCDYTAAFLAMAREAVEGAIYLREGTKAKQFVRIVKLGKPVNRWMKFEDDAKLRKFGSEAIELEKNWADAIKDARATSTAKAAEDTKREARKQAKSNVGSQVVELPANPSRVIALADGTLAVAAGTKVCFVAPTGELLGTSECNLGEYDMFECGITGLAAMDDGRVLAFQELGYEARIADRTQPMATALKLAERNETVKGGFAQGASIVLRTNHSAVILDASGKVTQTLTPWPDDYIYKAAPWRGGVLVGASDKTAWFDKAGTQKIAVEGELAMTRDETFLVYRDGELAVIDAKGKDVSRITIGDVGHGSAEDGYPKSWALRDDRFIAATRWPSAVREVSLTTGALTWKHDENVLASMPGGLCATASGSLVAAWSPPPYIRQKDHTVFVVSGKRVVTRLDPKAPVLGMVALGETAFAAFVDGRTPGTKVFVWRDVESKPKLETLAGHKGRVRGLIALEANRLVSWAADKTLRIWTI